MAAVLWSCRWNRNELVWNGESKNAAFIVNRSVQSLAEWRSVRTRSLRAVSAGNSSEKKWVRPPAGFTKCNIDASLFPASVKFGFGGILRDQNGRFVSAIQGSFAGRVSPVIAEAVGLREVLSWLKEKQMSRVLIEVDSKLVADAFNNKEDDFSYFAMIIDDCKALLRDLNQCHVSFIYRSANHAAHSLARAADSVSGWKVWDVCPAFVDDVILSDSN